MTHWTQRYEMLGLFRRIGMAARARLDSHLQPYGLSAQQGRIIGLLNSARHDDQPVVQLDIQVELGITGASTTSLLQGLERKGYIRRRVSSADGRAKELTITEKGQQLVEEFDDVFREVEERLVAGLTDDERATASALLTRMWRNMAGDSELEQE
jgi:MarR family transcriptional repressor of mepA